MDASTRVCLPALVPPVKVYSNAIVPRLCYLYNWAQAQATHIGPVTRLQHCVVLVW